MKRNIETNAMKALALCLGLGFSSLTMWSQAVVGTTPSTSSPIWKTVKHSKHLTAGSVEGDVLYRDCWRKRRTCAALQLLLSASFAADERQ